MGSPSPPDGDVVATLVRVHRELLTGERETEPTVLPGEPPAPWKGVGPYGQGGEGMMGGRPYSRPMTMTGPDRDGLALDRLPLRIGPFFPAFPPGLALDIVLQGDVVQEAKLAANPFASANDGSPQAVGQGTDGVFAAALRHKVSVADLERARARHHLRWLAHALSFHGLPAFAVRVLRLVPASRWEASARYAAYDGWSSAIQPCAGRRRA